MTFLPINSYPAYFTRPASTLYQLPISPTYPLTIEDQTNKITQNTNPMNQQNIIQTKNKNETLMVRVRTLHPQQTFKQLTSPIFPQAILQPLTRNTFILLIKLINYDKLPYTMNTIRKFQKRHPFC